VAGAGADVIDSVLASSASGEGLDEVKAVSPSAFGAVSEAELTLAFSMEKRAWAC